MCYWFTYWAVLSAGITPVILQRPCRGSNHFCPLSCFQSPSSPFSYLIPTCNTPLFNHNKLWHCRLLSLQGFSTFLFTCLYNTLPTHILQSLLYTSPLWNDYSIQIQFPSRSFCCCCFLFVWLVLGDNIWHCSRFKIKALYTGMNPGRLEGPSVTQVRHV